MIQKLKNIIIENVKNVEHGEISFTEKAEFLNVTGIYGQNGSGKTTLIDVMEITKRLILGLPLNNNVTGMIDDKKNAKMAVTTEIIGERINTYSFELKKVIGTNHQMSTLVVTEKLLSKKLKKGTQHRRILSFDRDSEEIVQTNSSKAFASLDALSIINDVTADKHSSYLFSDNINKLLQSNQKYEEQIMILRQFKEFAQNIRVYTSEYSGLISANIITPVGIHYQDDFRKMEGVLPFQMKKGGGFIPKELIKVYKNVIQQMNILLPEIIPNLKLDLIEREVRLGQNGQDEVRLEFIANRGKKRFALQYESDGIKKIIGLVSFLVEVYNNPNVIAAIDEFDSGIFEYLLGEFVDVLGSGAKGQLIFTSHNLRVLEMLPTNRMVFSTANPMNRYIRMKGVKRTNNLRDFYIRAIQLGGQEEELYVGQPAHKIRMALIKAGGLLG